MIDIAMRLGHAAATTKQIRNGTIQEDQAKRQQPVRLSHRPKWNFFEDCNYCKP
jgi:hypothetical protein